nr:beta-ketoacyl-[acyl-carrier-protein] synthase II [Clostridia bacterium]
AVSTACATGTTAIDEGYRAIMHGYCDAAVCGGSEASINDFAVAGFAACQTLSSAADANEASLPFDSRRGGFVMGEGAAALILEEYEHAVNRGAKIYAEVCGYGSTCDAYHVTAPSEDTSASSAAINQARENIMNIPADRIYYNAHGTGTALNDKIETAAVKAAFGDEAYKLRISSTKSMTGHMLGATGAAEAIAAIAALNRNLIPPTINLNSPDEALDLDYTPNTAKEAELDAVLSMSLGFGGHNACIAFRKVTE